MKGGVGLSGVGFVTLCVHPGVQIVGKVIILGMVPRELRVLAQGCRCARASNSLPERDAQSAGVLVAPQATSPGQSGTEPSSVL